MDIRVVLGGWWGGDRYCHVYRKDELAALVAAVPGMAVVDTYYDTSNWCVVAQREETVATAPIGH